MSSNYEFIYSVPSWHNSSLYFFYTRKEQILVLRSTLCLHRFFVDQTCNHIRERIQVFVTRPIFHYIMLSGIKYILILQFFINWILYNPFLYSALTGIREQTASHLNYPSCCLWYNVDIRKCFSYFLWETFWYFFTETFANFPLNFKLLQLICLLSTWLKSVQQCKAKHSKNVLFWHCIKATWYCKQCMTCEEKHKVADWPALPANTRNILSKTGLFFCLDNEIPIEVNLCCLASLQMLHTTLLLILYK